MSSYLVLRSKYSSVQLSSLNDSPKKSSRVSEVTCFLLTTDTPLPWLFWLESIEYRFDFCFLDIIYEITVKDIFWCLKKQNLTYPEETRNNILLVVEKQGSMLELQIGNATLI